MFERGRGGRGPDLRRRSSCWPTSTCRRAGSFVEVDDPDLGPMTVQAPGRRVERDARAASSTSAGPSGRTTTRSTATCSASTPSAWRRCGRPGRSEPRSEQRTGDCGARTASPAIGAGHAGQQRAHVREGGRRPGPTSCSSTSRTPARPSVKEAARAIAVGALTDLDWGRTVRAVRVNGLDTPWCHDDIIEIVTGAARARSTCSSCRRSRTRPRRLVGRRAAHPARGQARAGASASASRC